MTWAAVAVLAAAIVLLPVPLAAADKLDTVVLVNGDRITCEVSTLRRGQVTVKTDDSGTLTIKWDKVVSVTTVGLFDVSTSDGARFVGQLDAAPGGQIAILDPVAGDTHTFMLADVVSLAPIRAGFFQRIDGSLDVGASYTQSSGISQTSFNGTANYRRPAFAVFGRASTTLTSDPASGASTRASAQVGYVRYRPNLWVVSPFALFESNEDLGFETRYTGALTIGKYLVQTNRGIILLSGGGALGREQPVDGEAIVNVDGIATFDAAFFNYDFPKTTIDFGVQAFPGLNNAGRIRLNTTLTFRREVFRDVNLSISGYDNYDNRPESADANTNDIGYSLALGWTF
jgi:hypothetical protein